MTDFHFDQNYTGHPSNTFNFTWTLSYFLFSQPMSKMNPDSGVVIDGGGDKTYHNDNGEARVRVNRASSS